MISADNRISETIMAEILQTSVKKIRKQDMYSHKK